MKLKKLLAWWAIAALLIVAVRLLSSCAPPIVNVWATPFSAEDPALAHTMCDVMGNPIILYNEERFLRDSEPPRWAWKYILIHEQEHVRQIRKAGGCTKAMMLYRTDSTFRIATEFEASCVGLHALSKDGRIPNHREFYDSAFEALYLRYGTFTSRKEAKTAWNCRPRGG